jgi:ATP-dependent metalloprotease FtsH
VDRFPLEVSEDLAYVCGLIASDGAFGEDGARSIPFVNTELALHERVREVLEREFGYSPKRYLNAKHYENALPQGRKPVLLQDCWTTSINSRLLCTALRALNAGILELHADYVAAWLRGVLDGDGHVKVLRDTPQIVISAWKRPENERIRAALLRVGIPTSLSPRSSRGEDGNIHITGLEFLRRLVFRVYSDHPKKRAAMDRLIEMLGARETSSSRLDSIPVGPALAAARRSIGMGQRSFSRGHVVSAYERGLNSPSRTSLQAVVEEMETWRLARKLEVTQEFELVRDLAQSAVLWTRVEAIKPLEAGEPVYDLCLDRYHNFVASRLFTHNCIIFVDEIDAVGRHRGAGLGGGHDEREQTLNQLLVEMDGFESNEGVIMVAATNRPDVLDPALLRPGRFDRQIVVDWPDVRGREGILKVHTRKIPLAEDVDLKSIARSTPGMAGAELANIVNEAALLAARRNHKKVSDRDFEDAKDKVMMGAERRSLVMTEGERKSTAYHEAGHALVAWLLPGSDPVTKVTIIPRGRALGVTFYTPQEERHNHSKKQLEDRLCHAMGGRAAERLIFEQLTTGAANDLEQATNIARSMVTRFGMSDRLGPLTFGKKDEMVFLGRELATHKDYSEQTAVLIDQEVREIVERADQMALKLLRENQDKLHVLANTLLERETLDGDEMDRVLRGEKLEPMQKNDGGPTAADATGKPEATPADGGQQLDAFGGPAPNPAGA